MVASRCVFPPCRKKHQEQYLFCVGCCQECFCLRGQIRGQEYGFLEKSRMRFLFSPADRPHACSSNRHVMAFPHVSLHERHRGSGMWSSRKVGWARHISCDLRRRRGALSFPKSFNTHSRKFTASAKMQFIKKSLKGGYISPSRLCRSGKLKVKLRAT